MIMMNMEKKKEQRVMMLLRKNHQMMKKKTTLNQNHQSMMKKLKHQLMQLIMQENSSIKQKINLNKFKMKFKLLKELLTKTMDLMMSSEYLKEAVMTSMIENILILYVHLIRCFSYQFYYLNIISIYSIKYFLVYFGQRGSCIHILLNITHFFFNT